MFDIGFSELFLFGVIALIVLGPEKLPQAARTVGQWYAKLRRAAASIQSEIEAELDLAETRQQMQQELTKIRQTEANMRREMAELRGNMKAFERSQNDNLAADTQNHSKKSISKNEDNDYSPHKTSTEDTSGIVTRPWENMWFRLGAYDKARRLPAPPRLPNYQADALLYHQPSRSQKPTQPPDATKASQAHSAPCASKQETAE